MKRFDNGKVATIPYTVPWETGWFCWRRMRFLVSSRLIGRKHLNMKYVSLTDALKVLLGMLVFSQI